MQGRALIAGGGIGGLTVALCLARADIPAVVFEQAPAFEELGAGVQISPNGSRVLHHLGLAAQLGAVACLPASMEIRNWRSGKIISTAVLGETATAAYGSPYYHVHRGDLLRLLVEAALQEPRIELHTGAKVVGFEQDGECPRVSVAGSTGTIHHEGTALIGADGIHSEVRRALFGHESPRFTGSVAWRALVPAERLPKSMVRPFGAVWWGPRAHFVHYFVRGGTLVNCVAVVEKNGWEVESWTEPSAGEREERSPSHEQHGEYTELKADFAGWHSEIQILIDCMDRNSLYKWALHDRPPMPRWGEGAVTLLGDACHPMLPFMAQGAVAAMEDAAVLAGCLAHGTHLAAGLERYEALRRHRTALMQAQARRNAKVFHLAGPAAWLRDRLAKRAGGRIMERLYRYDALAVARQGT